ncbi:vascular cell adhesion protein 1-like [Haliotis asinina]|uniref:vascular cell adhesion protein 1-like n=1 Tax=Haliotis asinina TaxID=109174 RepID=UPI0035320984
MHRLLVLISVHSGYRITYGVTDSLSRLRFTISNVTVQDAGTYYCQGTDGHSAAGCTQLLVVAQKPTTPTTTGPASPVSDENVTLTCSSSSRSLPQDHHPLTMTYIWRRDRTMLESGDESPTGGDDLTITHVSRENQGDIYRCQAVEEGLESDWSHGHVLDVLFSSIFFVILCGGRAARMMKLNALEENTPIMIFHFFCLKTVIFFGCTLEFAASYTNTVARVGQNVNMTWSVSQSVQDFKITSITYKQQTPNRNDSTVLFIVDEHKLQSTSVNTHTENGTRIQLNVSTSMEGRKQVILTFHSVDVQDAGVPNININSNKDKITTISIHLFTEKPSKPNIITTVADPVSGDPVNLTCSTTFRSLPADQSLYRYTLNTSYTWRRNNSSVDSRVDNRVHVDGQFLTIDYVTKEDKGVYSCQSGEEGLLSDWSRGYTLSVLYGPDQIHFDGTRDKLQIEEGKHVTVRCSADCNPACSVTWMEISRQVVITGHREAVLSIAAVDVSLSGQYTCHVNNTHGSASRNLKLEVLIRELNESGVVSMVRVAAICSVLIVVIVVVVIVVVCRKHRLGGRGCILNRIVTYTRDSGADGGYQEIVETGYADYRLVSYHREDENDGSYQEIEGGDVNVDDIVPIVAVYSVMLTVVAVVVAAVTVLVCKDVKEDQGRRCGDYLTVMAERLSHDFSDVPRASNNDVLPLHDYERLLREQFHIYTCLHPQSFSTEDHSTM